MAHTHGGTDAPECTTCAETVPVPALSTSADVETVIRRELPRLLVEEYGETATEWRELGSVRRIAKELAAALSTPPTEESRAVQFGSSQAHDSATTPPTEGTALGDHPHVDPGDGRTECYLCGKFVHDVIHSCKGVPVTRAAEDRVRALIDAVRRTEVTP